jgi:hypothetical protein
VTILNATSSQYFSKTALHVLPPSRALRPLLCRLLLLFAWLLVAALPLLLLLWRRSACGCQILGQASRQVKVDLCSLTQIHHSHRLTMMQTARLTARAAAT